MRILYGIQCTGNGHVNRSMKIISKLKKLGHVVDIVLSGKNSNIILPFEVKYRFKGFTFFNTKNGGIDYLKTFASFDFFNFIKDITLHVEDYDKVISDFEPVTAWACKLHGIECYGISNQYSFISKKTPRDGKSYVGEFILKNMAPVDNPIGLHYDNYDDFIYKPIINNSIIRTKTQDYGYYSVYLPSFNLNNILTELTKSISKKFHIFHNDINSIYRYKNCLIYPIDKKIFISSFVNSHGIIANAGFQTSAEALYMSKKLMVIPVKGQYEQESNAFALQKLGIFSGKLNNITDFLETDKVLFDKWDDPTDSIINLIIG